MKLKEINLTNQLIGEVQHFIFVMRWVIYQFYNFRQLERDQMLHKDDFKALDDDIIFILHKISVKGKVFPILLVLSRMLNYKTDKQLRQVYRLIEKHQHPLFPIQ